MFDFLKKKPKQGAALRLPPVPDWKPEIVQPLDRVIDRVRYYSSNRVDFAVFTHGTCALLSDGLSDAEARALALELLSRVFNAHPDFTPVPMDDGNTLVKYSQPVYNVVLSDVVEKHWKDIDANHSRALATHESLIIPEGHNGMSDVAKKGLFGRCYMFMDGQDPKVVQIVRKAI